MPKPHKAAILLVTACVADSLLAYDIRVISPVSVWSVIIQGTPVTQLNLGGRIGNWRSDNTVIMDSNITSFMSSVPANSHLTDIFTIPAGGGAANIISLDNAWSLGGGATILPPARNSGSAVYVGNAWTCPGNEYTLFQASEPGSTVGYAADSGSGVDNNVWIYRASTQTIWRLTTYTVGTGQGVLGPQCSSDSSGTALHIVFSHLIQGPTNSCSSGPSGGGPSDGKCQWFGDWELIYADVNIDGSGNPASPFLNSPVSVKPREVACTPICTLAISSTGSSTAGSANLSATGFPFTTAMAGTAISVTGAGSGGATLNTTIFSVTDSGHVVLANLASTTASGETLTVANKVIYEPHLYVANKGDLYFTSNRRLTTHDGSGCIFNLTTGYFNELTLGAPLVYPMAFQNTWFNEFVTPNPTLNQQIIFMSDRGVSMPGAPPTQAAACLTMVPECSDYYMCTMPQCSNVIRLSYFNFLGYPESTTPFVTATRGAWSPDGTKYATLTQFSGANAQINVFNLQYPSSELSGPSAMSGKARLK